MKDIREVFAKIIGKSKNRCFLCNLNGSDACSSCDANDADKILSLVIGEEEVECPKCEGDGECSDHGSIHYFKDCPKCSGTGKIKRPVTINDAIERKE